MGRSKTQIDAEDESLDERFTEVPEWWREVARDDLPPSRILGYRELWRLQRSLRNEETLWKGRFGAQNWLRLVIALLSGALLWMCAGNYGAMSWMTMGAGVVFAFALVSFIGMLLVGLKIVATAEWIGRLAAGDLEFRMQFGGDDVFKELCVALDILRERSKRVVRLQVVERLTEQLEKKNEAFRETADTLTRTQDQIIARQKAAELGELAASIAKEIQASIGFVKNLAESTRKLMKDEGKDAQPSDCDEARQIETEIDENLDRILENAERTEAVIARMLALDTGDEGRKTRVNLHDSLSDYARFAISTAEQGDETERIRLEEDFDETIELVHANEQGIATLTLNLVANACQAIAERSQARNGADPYEGRIRIGTRRKNGQIHISFEDNGAGMDEDTARRAMTPFFTTKPPNTGTGLGLSHCAEIAHAHDATLEIHTRHGQGTRIDVCMNSPAAKRELR